MTETMVNAELFKLTKRAPRTTAERAFHAWLLQWQQKLAQVKAGEKA